MNSPHTAFSPDEEKFTHSFQVEGEADHPRTLAAFEEKFAPLLSKIKSKIPELRRHRHE